MVIARDATEIRVVAADLIKKSKAETRAKNGSCRGLPSFAGD